MTTGDSPRTGVEKYGSGGGGIGDWCLMTGERGSGFVVLLTKKYFVFSFFSFVLDENGFQNLRFSVRP